MRSSAAGLASGADLLVIEYNVACKCSPRSCMDTLLAVAVDAYKHLSIIISKLYDATGNS